MADVRTFLRQVHAELDRREYLFKSPMRKKWLAQIDGYRKEWDKFVAPRLLRMTRTFPTCQQSCRRRRAGRRIDRPHARATRIHRLRHRAITDTGLSACSQPS